MKNSIILLFAFVMIFSSCSKSTSNLESIPKNASSVTAINLTSLIRKLDYSSMKDLKFMRAMNKEIAEENRKASRMMEDLMENPMSSGFDFLSDVYVYTLNEAEDENFVCVSIALKNKDKFKDFAKKLIRETEEDYELIEETAFEYFLMRNLAISFDDSKAVILLPINRSSRKNLDYQAEALMELSEEKQITNDENFSKFIKEKEDISFWISSNAFKGEREFRQAEKEFGFDLSDNFLSSHISFNKGQIELSSNFSLNEDLKKEMAMDIMGKGLGGKLLNYFPKEYLAIYAFSVNTDELFEAIEDEKEYDKLADQFEKMTKNSLQEFIQNLEGNVLIDVYGMRAMEIKTRYGTRTKEMPLVGAVLDFKNKEVIYDLINQMPEDFLVDFNDYFEIELPGMSPVYLAVNENELYVSNDYDGLLDYALADSPKNTLNDAEIASNLKNNASFASLNLNIANYPNNIKDMMYENMGREERKMMRIFENTAEGINVYMEDNTSARMTLDLANKDENSLNTIIKFVDDNYKSIMEL